MTPSHPTKEGKTSGQILMQLEHAINEGNTTKARCAATALSNRRQKFQLTPWSKNSPDLSNVIRLNIIVADIDTSKSEFTKVTLKIDVPYDTTIADLKRRVCLEHDFPPAIQIWMMGQCIPVNKNHLNDLLPLEQSVNLEGMTQFTVSLYLLVPLSSPFTHSGDRVPSIVQNDSFDMDEEPLTLPDYDESDTLLDYDDEEDENIPVENPLPWSCKACTFLNEAYNVNCQVCMSDRPT